MKKFKRFIKIIVSVLPLVVLAIGLTAIVVNASVVDLSSYIQTQKAGTQHVNPPYIGITPTKITALSFDDQLYKYTAPIRVYYFDAQYETGKHKIIEIWTKSSGQLPPEALQDTAINVPYSVIEIDTEYSPTAKDLVEWGEMGKYYVDSKSEIIAVVGWKPPFLR